MDEDSKSPKPFVPQESNEETRLYWDRLDAKFANAPGAQPPSAPPPSAPPAFELPEPIQVPEQPPAPTAPAPPRPAASGLASGLAAGSASGSPLIAEAFSALLALEEGYPGAKPVRLTTDGGGPQPVAEPPEITDAVIDEVVRRVIERLGPDAVRSVVVEVVSQISERLVKEEIDRIRNEHV